LKVLMVMGLEQQSLQHQNIWLLQVLCFHTITFINERGLLMEIHTFTMIMSYW
jgi:hypothetical protein